MIRTDISNEMIVDLYFNKNFNRRQCSEKLNCSQDLIVYRLKQMGLKPKNMSKCVQYIKQNSIEMSDNLYKIIDGELLGDGCVFRTSIQADFRESFGYNKKEWAEYLILLFKNNNIPIVGNKIYKRNPSGKSKNITWSFSTINTIQFSDIHKRWYIENKNFDIYKKKIFANRKNIKIVPTDIQLYKKTLLHWYIGDASVNLGGGCMIHTEGFNFNAVEFLRFKLLNEFDIKTSHSKKNTIYVPKSERIKLLEIIGDCPVECYKYKWNKTSNTCKLKDNFNYQINMKMIEDYIRSINGTS